MTIIKAVSLWSNKDRQMSLRRYDVAIFYFRKPSTVLISTDYSFFYFSSFLFHWWILNQVQHRPQQNSRLILISLFSFPLMKRNKNLDLLFRYASYLQPKHILVLVVLNSNFHSTIASRLFIEFQALDACRFMKIEFLRKIK